MELFLLIYFGIGLYFGGMLCENAFQQGESRIEAFLISLIGVFAYPFFAILAIYSIYKDIKNKK